MRISVTDRCNLRCMYCMPPDGVPLISHDDILRHEEIVRVVEAAARLGISHIRITGGEPLLRHGIVSLVRMIAQVPGISDVSMTTNGCLLGRYAEHLAEAGLKRVNVSMDTLRPERARDITGHDCLAQVLQGIEVAEACGLQPIKINTVVLRSINLDEIQDLAMLTRLRPWHVRFIELMPSWGAAASLDPGEVVPAEEIAERLRGLGAKPVAANCNPGGAGPARYMRLPGSKGTLGIVGSEDGNPRGMCERCNRLRLSSDGKLYACLFSTVAVDLRDMMRSGASIDELCSAIRGAISNKPRYGRDPGSARNVRPGTGHGGASGGRPALAEIGG
ncbi:MAG TPA: GTP 3',8-cyclase MoaA [Firmicutes bacterium]|nr:GTP 3',8-cyclase MoaA [Bacillota bacterium]